MKLPRHAEIWLPGYLKSRAGSLSRNRWQGAARVWVTIADHFEPLGPGSPNGCDREQWGRERVALWEEKWPRIAAKHRDSTGSPPKYTFFFPEDEYRPHFLAALAKMTRAGIADVEIHIHHDGEGEQSFLDRMNGFRETLFQRHGLLRKDAAGQIVFGFIHGNWALDNSRPDGRYCGLNNEITLLRDMGCYADFTMPSGASPTQSRTVNQIYWVVDDPERPRSYDRGRAVVPGANGKGDLLMIPGPFGLRWEGRLAPRLETGELAGYNRPSEYRVKRWLDLAPRIGTDIFLKLFTHGAQERNSSVLLEGDLDRTFALLRDECAREGCELRFVSAWEMRQAVDRAAALNAVAERSPVTEAPGR
jgi:hypothetical protein